MGGFKPAAAILYYIITVNTSVLFRLQSSQIFIDISFTTYRMISAATSDRSVCVCIGVRTMCTAAMTQHIMYYYYYY